MGQHVCEKNNFFGGHPLFTKYQNQKGIRPRMKARHDKSSIFHKLTSNNYLFQISNG